VSILKRAERKAARERARLAADEEIAERLRQSELERAAQQSEIDAAWQRLVHGDPETVLGALEAAFEDNEFPAASLDATEDHVYLIVTLPPTEGLVPERTLNETAAGNITVKKRTKTERNSTYMMMLISAMAATAKVPRPRFRPDTRLDPGGLHVESQGGPHGGTRGGSLQRP